ncbi:MAG: RNA pseudouridine synthase [Opitutaceae bacterium]
MPATARGFEILPSEFESWIRNENADWICFDKPPLVVCHPSKHGPTSSLVGAFRAYRDVEAAHLVFRIDRETSGVVLVAKNREAASRLQQAVEKRMVHKEYIAILHGELRENREADHPLGRHPDSPIVAKQGWRPTDGRAARTLFEPLATGGGFTLVRVRMDTGRQHQIRAHGELIGHPLVGDKIYGVPPAIFLSFIDNGWTPDLEAVLAHYRHALHARRIVFDLPDGPLVLETPLAPDLIGFCRERMEVDATGIP